MIRMLVRALTVFVVAVGATVGGAAEWGNLSGQIIYDGPAPVPEKASVTKDQDECCKHDVINESLLVDPESKGVQNVVIVLYQGRADTRTLPIHESYESLKKQPVRLDNSACRFDPHVALIWTEQKVILENTDPIGHNVNATTQANRPFNVTIPTGNSIEKAFSLPERMPVSVSCSIHPWMKGWVVIRDNPYMATTDKQGRFTIKNLPVGKWEFMFWHELAGYISKVRRGKVEEEWSRGRVELEITPGDNDLGQIVVSPTLFSK